ncbi:ATP-binding protein [Candidatus Sulfurimonas baltica]|uniref:ATP-binding protein n=1 Tax=Candidatus Sulfurimonas baltica TaxID=2740404 RepID=A0A7S7LXM1_9BACT|nr:ATP-binding protein [Candidatus Sulfurimonas baltica]QOY53241.1 ATP-binding protein [Candidatus Sulfurimonas baltica]
MFVNRTNELKALEDEYKKSDATFSVMYGRRRVGKTSLLSKYIESKPSIYLYITLSDLNSQLSAFTQQIRQFAPLSIAKHLKFDSFEEALEFLATLELEKKLVLVIDEYQYLTQLDKTFSSKLQKIWDMSLINSNIHLILCGSVLSMMHSEVLAYNAPLYGRRTSQFHIKAIKFNYLQEFLPGSTKLELMQIYASFGSIPKYLNEYDSSMDFMQNIEQKILNKNSYLYSEGNFLLKDEISDARSYFSILESISKGNTKIGHIGASLGLASSYLTKYMQRLIELDIIEKEVPVTETNPLKSKFGRYKIKDKFLNFWFFYVFKNYNFLEIEQKRAVLDEIELNFNDRFVSFAFEDYVVEDILENPKKYLDFIPTKVGRWWNNKEEIDIVAFDDENICFIECKWQNRVDEEKVKEKLMQKSINIVSDKTTSYLVVTKDSYLKESI